MDLVLVDRTDSLLTITLNRPERLNAVIPDLFDALSDACTLAADPSVRAVILTGRGRGFCVGGDIKAPPSALQPGSRRQRRHYTPAIVQLAGLDKPVIAAVNGPAVGAGLSLAAAADIRVASDKALFKAGFVDAGLAPDTGSSYFLVRLLGYGRAFDFLAGGKPVTAEEARDLGLVNEVVAHDGLMERAQEIARSLADKPGIAVSATKALLRTAARASLLEQLEAEAQAYDVASADEERIAARAAMVNHISKAVGGERE
ncbi:enoyl-CoA hydratase/isomerase family protein [Mycolicibacterium sp. P9-22]|uniref:enoyl-CoA hydratase/isomerase family protein n=1 Tax=Mycolicibacterium sp. P9-22 TaxID=2024613 RepID=UPI0011EF97DA|nr:enoyl-CoA hydratase-related protein [Mycolicibacterium sp. P9-22]KAA0120647.1 enoyl-CoA hydratase/isomerase family protein [Mycolicibacterium sp. P9-22]